MALFQFTKLLLSNIYPEFAMIFKGMGYCSTRLYLWALILYFYNLLATNWWYDCVLLTNNIDKIVTWKLFLHEDYMFEQIIKIWINHLPDVKIFFNINILKHSSFFRCCWTLYICYQWFILVLFCMWLNWINYNGNKGICYCLCKVSLISFYVIHY